MSNTPLNEKVLMQNSLNTVMIALGGNALSPKDLLKEAKQIFPNTLLAKDFLQINVEKPETVCET